MFQVPKISYSLLASLGKHDLNEVVAMLPGIGVDLIHFDVSEEEKTLRLNQIPSLRKFTSLPFDVHLAVADPEKHIPADLSLDAIDRFCIHVENGYTLDRLSLLRKRLGCQFGLAINIETGIEALVPFAPILDYVLFMAARPGVSGGSFNDAVIEKMQKFQTDHPRIKIHVDGGVNNVSAALLRTLGVNVMISGSYILKDNNYTQQVAKLVGQNLHLPAVMMMHTGSELPVVAEGAPIDEVAKRIDVGGIGCVCVLSRDGIYVGLITDADLRRRLIAHTDLSRICAKDIMNTRSFTIDPDTSIIKLIRTLDRKASRFTVVPVVDPSGKCLGVLRLQDILFSNVLGLRMRNQSDTETDQ